MRAQKLIEILDGNGRCEVYGPTDLEVSGITLDSRKIEAGFLFAAIRGATSDGHSFIEMAIEKGASLILCTELPQTLKANVCYLKVAHSAQAFAKVSQAFYDFPAEKLMVIGVTGTNGKTTVATLLFQLFTELGFKCGLLSTVENKIGVEIVPATHTTPDAQGIAALMDRMVTEGCTYAFMEVSSHALDQERVFGIPFKGAIFTNITHDHLDYHGTFLNYQRAKRKFFDQLSSEAFTMINLDDRNGKSMYDHTKAKVKTYGLKSMADYRCKVLSNDTSGLHLWVDGKEVMMGMMGEFNAYNLLAVYGTAKELGFESDKILQILSYLPGAEGRMQLVKSKNTKIVGIVDYAHTPDALENITETLKKSKPIGSSLITVFGCGGDRDKTKRPEMGKIAAQKSDRVIITSDNPRSEDPDKIISEVLEGIPQELKNKVVAISDRSQAIKTAVMIAKGSDVVLVAGKGHEKYQEIKGEKLPFEDKKVLEDALDSKA
ncbi:MAG TPA: UDP-N-acetylmuramoyl-L-alanyl-D-glutamate--2,6-diaminopimelate ligase [Saprospiraceae bacterium]|nr:UDP-N-acetylmuramoyl-L-alanyl-D-glutamate--2,6-diaminopimelate ligase [Saprospiraceae bacterium]